ncbi:MAG: HlyD family type I secretion periplasmic adaptor subunit [Arcobacter sp.]|nr:HlyD family type I secretion periplasmic adaptor subunit [Arcobacter sp.]
MKKTKIDDYKYMNSVSGAMMEKVPSSSKVILYLIFILILSFLYWAYNAQIDQLVRGECKVIPTGQNQIVQNFEGGIISEILVEEGDLVQKGQGLLKLENKQYSSTYEKNILEIDELKAKKQRLYAEANDEDFKIEKNTLINIQEYDLYKSDLRQLESKLNILKEQIEQKRKEKKEINSKIRYLKQSFNLIRQEQKVMDPLIKKGLVSKVEYLKLLREANTIKEELERTKLSLNTINSGISEYENRQKEVKIDFKNKARKEYNEVVAKIQQFSKKNQGLKDQVSRTLVKAPVTGYVKKMFVNTIGGSVKAGMSLVEIVPKEKELLVEAKISPKDIAFIHPQQEVTLKFTAYDFAIYGSLKGKIKKIAPDSITSKDKKTYYLIYIKTNKDYLGRDDKPLKIIPGMRGSADIITGKNTVLNYILKPIIKTKQYALTQR